MQEVIADKGVSSGARHLFHVLKDFARGKNWPECWPFMWRLREETGRSERMLQYYLRELMTAGAVEIVRSPGKGNRYRILLDVKDKISQCCTEAPPQPIAGVGVQPIAGVPPQPIAGVNASSIIYEADTQQAAQGTEVPAAAAAEKILEEEMRRTKKNVFDELTSLGMPLTQEMVSIVKNDEELAWAVANHCKSKFARRGKHVESPEGYIVVCMRKAAKYGLRAFKESYPDPEEASARSAEARSQAEAARKSANQAALARIEADAEKAYIDMRNTWERLPEEARQEIRDFVLKDRPLFHGAGTDESELEFQCMKLVLTPGRWKWLQKHLGNSKR